MLGRRIGSPRLELGCAACRGIEKSGPLCDVKRDGETRTGDVERIPAISPGGSGTSDEWFYTNTVLNIEVVFILDRVRSLTKTQQQ